MKVITILFLGVIIYSCNNKSRTEGKPFEYKPRLIKRIYSRMAAHEIEGYTHYLTIENYEDGFSNFFVDHADAYRDTCKTDLPIWNVRFCEPFDFIPHYDSRDDEPLRKHSIVDISYQEQTLHKKFPEIGSVTFFRNGTPIYIQTMTLERMKNAGYYDSNGGYKREWIKEFDKKFNTHFSDTAKH
jgi:hypothetical protein